MTTLETKKNLTPYWTDSCRELSSHLWLPTKIDLLDLGQNSLNTWSNKTVENSWFSIKLITHLQKPTCLAFSTYSPVECIDSENTLVKSKKIRIYPSSFQKELLKECLGVSRYVYNKTIEYLKIPGTIASWLSIKTDILNSLPAWCKEVPYQIKSMAIKDACLAVSNAKKKFKGSGQFNQVKFKSRKDPRQSFYLPKSAVSEDGFYKTIFGEMVFKEPIPVDFKDCRLSFYLDKWYICVPYPSKVISTENQGRIVSLDPGVRTFQTFYSENSCGKLGDGDFGRIHRLCAYLDKLMSKKEKAPSRRKNSIKKAINSLRFKIKNLVDDLHHKVAYFLVTNFDTILLPIFETQKMSSRTKRRIGKKSVRAMLTWAHFRFKNFLKSKAFEYGKTVIDVNEAYTSKTVSWTGEIVPNLGGSKSITSTLTGDIMDRDYNGARGIFLRALVDSPSLFKTAIVNII